MLALLLIGAAACNKTKSGDPPVGLPVGAVVPNPATGRMVIIEENARGEHSNFVFVGEPVWGRLVDVWATDPATGLERLYFSDYLVGQEIGVTPSLDYRLERNPATGRESLTILYEYDSNEYLAAFAQLEVGLQAFLDRSLDPGELPPFTALPRNAAVALRMNDLLDDGGDPGSVNYPGSVHASTVQVFTGYPPRTVFEARILPDPNHGDFINGQFHSTRVLIDMSVSQAEAAVAGVPPNILGLPEAVTTEQAGAVIRIPTRVSVIATQFELLQNLTGHSLKFTGNGSVDPFAPTLDVVRAFRSGGKFDITGDLYNGFLMDDKKPRLMGSQNVTVIDATDPTGQGMEFDVDFSFATPTCGTTPIEGDLLVMPLNVLLRVKEDHPTAPTTGGDVFNVRCTLVSGFPGNVLGPVAADFRTPWRQGLTTSPNCFVRFAPDALTEPNMEVTTSASVVLSFDEPVFPESLNAFDGVVIQKSPPPTNALEAFVMSDVSPSVDLLDITIDPLVALDHASAASERYTIDVLPAVVDLAGNPLLVQLPQTDFFIDPTDPEIKSGSVGSSFTNFVQGMAPADVDDDNNLLPEYRGQFISDVGRGRILPRSVQRFSGTADPASQPSVGAMLPAFLDPLGVPLAPLATVEPMTPYGSRLMTLWRYFDLGLTLTDESTYNLDVEGLAWAPLELGVHNDFFPLFEMSLAHSMFLPDEAVNTSSGLLDFPSSGLSETFAANQLDPVNDPLRVVHKRTEGYLVQEIDKFTAASGTTLAPFPLNLNKPLADFNYYTYRDTSITKVGAPLGAGADPQILGVVDPANANVGAYAAGMVPTIGLPLLMEFKAFPTNSVIGLNQWQVLYADVAGAMGVGGSPFFRVHSTGNTLPTGGQSLVSPDNASTAIGGIDVNGNPTFPGNSSFYLGQADFVVRVNRVHSIWFDGKGPSNWADPLVLPAEQPGGTALTLAFRGAAGMAPSGGQNDATKLDTYGNKIPGSAPFGVVFLNGDSSWKTSLQALAGAQYVQVRITMISNAESEVSPALTALGLGHRQ